MQPVGLVLAERVRDQAEGVLGLAVSQPVRAAFPVRDDAEPPLLVLGQADQGPADAGQVSGAAVGEREHHARQQGPDAQLPAPCPGRQHGLDLRRDAGVVDDLLERRQRDHRRVPPSSTTTRPGSTMTTASASS